MRKQNLPIQRLLTTETLTTLAHELRYPDITALYAAIGDSHVSAQSVVNRLVESLGGEEGATEDLAEVVTPGSRPATTDDPGSCQGATDIWVKLARCCTPVPGDGIVGFVTRGSGVSVHRSDCVNAVALTAQPDRMVEVEWAPSASSVFLVAIQVEALDRSRLLSDVTRVLSDQHVNILSASVTTTRDRVAISRFTFEMGDPKHLGHVPSSAQRRRRSTSTASPAASPDSPQLTTFGRRTVASACARLLRRRLAYQTWSTGGGWRSCAVSGRRR
jgi:GTP pyrophosphokinase